MQTNAEKTARFLKKARRDLGFTQIQFSRLFCVDRPSLSRYENARTQAPGALILEVLEAQERQRRGGWL